MKVSVAVTAYNHERYISQCMESVLMQKGDFQLEVVIGDDFSTDNTRAIIQEFQRKNPGIITVLPTEKNLGIAQNLKRCLSACSGEYIAICEGDDYWTDEYKLQKQKNFLDLHQDCSMCFSALLLYYEEKNLTIPHQAQSSLDRDTITIEDLIGNNYIGNFSCCMYRTDIIRKLPKDIYDLEINTDDWMISMAFGQFGKIGFLKEIMSVYRIHSKGAWSGKGAVEQLDFVCHHMDVSNRFFNYKYDALFTQRKQVFEDQITRLRASENAQKHEGRDFTYIINKIRLQTVNTFFKILQLSKNKLRELRHRYYQHR